MPRDQKQSASIAMLAEYEGQKIAGKTIAILSTRIDTLIRIAVAAERHRCFDAVSRANSQAQDKIINSEAL